MEVTTFSEKRNKQESPPAWTQEAYRLPRSKCSLCWWGGTPSSHVGGGYSIQSWWGVPHPFMVGGGGTPSSHGGGYPIHSWLVGGVPHPFMVGGGVPHPVMVGGTPSSHGGVPPTIQTWLGYPPPPTMQTWLGYPSPPPPHHPDLAGVPPSNHPELSGVPPPPPSRPGWGITSPPPQMLTDRHQWKQYLPVVLRRRAVKIM